MRGVEPNEPRFAVCIGLLDEVLGGEDEPSSCNNSGSCPSGIICCDSGTRSDGFSTNVLPDTRANGRNQSGTIAGKLKGVIAPTTPSGWRMTWQSTPDEMFSSP